MASELSSKECIPCRGGVPPLKGDDIVRLLLDLPDWDTVDEHHLVRTFSFGDFASALEFVNEAGKIAEEQGHHPDIYLTWGKVEVTIWTHKIDGLTESDFILAAKYDAIPKAN